MRNFLLLVGSFIFQTGNAQIYRNIESYVTFDKENSIKCNSALNYCLYKTAISNDINTPEDHLVKLHGLTYVAARNLPKYAAYVVCNSVTGDIISYLKSEGEFDSLYYKLKIVASDLGKKYLLIENPYYTPKNKPQLYDTSGWPIEELIIDRYRTYDVENKTDYIKSSSISSVSEFYYQLGWDLFNDKKYLNSLYCWRKYFDIECSKRTKENSGCISSCSFALMRMGECKEYLGDDYGAKDYYLKYVKEKDCISWNHMVTFISLAEIELRLKNYTNSIQYIDSAIKLGNENLRNIPPPNFGYMKLLKGYAFYNIKQVDKACAMFSESLELGEEKALAQINYYCNKPFQGEINVSFPNRQSFSEGKNPIIIPLLKKGSDLFEVEATLNGSVKVKFILDSGASQVTISSDVLASLITSETIKEDDFIGQHTFLLADGSQVKSDVFNLSSITIGGIKLTDIKTSVSETKDAPSLLGQNVLKKLGNYTIDYARNQLVIHRD